MASIDFVERSQIEELFDMSGGYVLDFSNRTFQEFVYEVIGIDVYQKYQYMSKAKMLRALIADSNNIDAGKLILTLLRYMKARGRINDKNQDLFESCKAVGNRLIGRTTMAESHVQVDSISPTPKHTITPITAMPLDSIDFDKYQRNLAVLTTQDDTPQARGFAFERFLKELFEDNGLDSRGSFRITGEQIDGSFVLFNDIYLLEAKWTNTLIDKAALVVFNEKVSSKSGFTRGLFISYSGYSEEALQTFSHGRTVNIVLMSVQELAVALERRMSIADIIWQKVRALAEEGNFNKPII